MSKEKPTLIIGLGNPILGDDGIGWVVAEDLQKIINQNPEEFDKEKFEFKFLSLGGLSLMEQMVGYTNVIVIDSIHTGTYQKGTIFSLPLSRLPNLSSGHSTAVHDTSLANALEVGRMMNFELPDDIWVLAIETDEVYTFSDKLSAEAQSALNKASIIAKELIVEKYIEQIIDPN